MSNILYLLLFPLPLPPPPLPSPSSLSPSPLLPFPLLPSRPTFFLLTLFFSFKGGEFSGVMKFFYQYEEKDGQKVATKCIKVTSNDTVPDVIEVLVQKFRPDLKMLPNLSSYSLYEIHNESREGGNEKTYHSLIPIPVQYKHGG